MEPAKNKPPKSRPRKQPPAPAPLSVSSLALTPKELAVLDRLTVEQTDLLGRAISRSSVLRALIRLAEDKIRPYDLRDAIEQELNEGRRWGKDSTKPPS